MKRCLAKVITVLALVMVLVQVRPVQAEVPLAGLTLRAQCFGPDQWWNVTGAKYCPSFNRFTGDRGSLWSEFTFSRGNINRFQRALLGPQNESLLCEEIQTGEIGVCYLWKEWTVLSVR